MTIDEAISYFENLLSYWLFPGERDAFNLALEALMKMKEGQEPITLEEHEEALGEANDVAPNDGMRGLFILDGESAEILDGNEVQYRIIGFM